MATIFAGEKTMPGTGAGKDDAFETKETRAPEDEDEVKRTEEALESERARLKAALDNIDQGVVMYDANWRLSLYNQRWVDLLGFNLEFLGTKPTLEEIIRNEVERGIDADLPGDTKDKVHAWMRPVRATDGPYVFEQHLADGTIIELWTNPLPSGGLIRTLTDITARRHLEQTLRESDKRYALAAVLSRVGHWTWDEIGDGCLHCSEEMAQIIGISVSECLEALRTRDDGLRLVHSDDRTRCGSAIRGMREQNEAYELEYRIVRPDGDVRYVREIREPNVNEAGEVVGSFGVVQDVTAQRSAEEALVQSQQQLRGLMDAIPADVTLKDAQGRFLMINKAMSSERRRPEAEVLGKTAYELYSKDVADDISKQEKEVLRTGRPVEHEYRLLGEDGTERFYLTVKFPIFDSNGVPSTVGTTSTDITERRHAQRQLELYHERVATELEMARQTQTLLIPSTATVDKISMTHDLHVASHFEPSSELGGDLWTLRSLDREKLSVIMVDFSGHGVNAALNTFRLHSLLFDEQLDAGNPASYLQTLNTRLVDLLPEGQFATLFFGIIDRARDRLDYAAAASQNPLIIGPDPKELGFEDGSGLPLGLFEDSVYENHCVVFPRGASLFLYSDALTESMMTGGERFGEDALLELARECLESRSRRAFLDTLLERFTERAVRPLKDDLTAVCVTRS